MALDEDEVRANLKNFLKPAEMNGLIERTELLVDHIQDLIDDRGEKAVLFTLRKSSHGRLTGSVCLVKTN